MNLFNAFINSQVYFIKNDSFIGTSLIILDLLILFIIIGMIYDFFNQRLRS